MMSERICRCGHPESAHRWAGDLGRCNTTPCRCLVYQMTPRDDAEARAMAAQDAVLRRYYPQEG